MATSDEFDRRQHRFPESRFFEDLAVGERFYIPSRTVTEANFAAFQTVSADNHPIHYDVEYCRERGHPAPLAPGFQGLFVYLLYRAILQIPKAGLSRRHALPEPLDRRADGAAHDRDRDDRGHR